MALNVRYQSGFPWAPVHHLVVPNVGTKAILLTTWRTTAPRTWRSSTSASTRPGSFDGHYRLTAIADVYNLFDVNPVTNFVLNTGSRFDDVIEWVPGLTLKLGLRFQF